MEVNNGKSGKSTAIISYITPVGAIIALFMNIEDRHAFASFHIRQALGIFISYFILVYFVGYLNSWFATTAFFAFFFILWIYGFISAVLGKNKPLPLIGVFYQNLFKSI